MTLDAQERSRLEKAVGRARQLLEEDYAAAAEGRFGLHRSGRIEDETALSLSSPELIVRRELVGVIQYLRVTGHSEKQAVDRLLREAAFTTLNRLIAIRVAEAVGLLPPCLADGTSSTGFRELVEIFPLMGRTEKGGYWTYLRLCADELAHDAPVLFDPRNPLLVLEPSQQTLEELIGILADAGLRHIWAEPDTFGWTYQFFNRPEERRQMRESAAPKNSRELAVRNQFFTPRYVVDFLVHNSLGRRLLEANPESQLREKMVLAVELPARAGNPLDLGSIRVLDPAVGSGHFLLGCYDILECAWAEQGVNAEGAASRILPALWGVDIDPRCAQVAAAALVLRARRRNRTAELPQPNIVTARPLPGDPNAWKELLSGSNGGVLHLVEAIAKLLADAPVLGPLLKVEERIRTEIEGYAPAAAAKPGMLFAGESRETFLAIESQLESALQEIAHQASSSPSERLFAAEATDALRFVEALQQRYDTVLMNPPFGDPVPQTKDYLKAAYSWIPRKDCNLLAAFVGRGLELCNENGYLGAITSRAGLFLTTYERWRKEVLLSRDIIALADLGFGVMQDALVEAAAYVVGTRRSTGHSSVFIRLLKEKDRVAALAEAATKQRLGTRSEIAYAVDAEELSEIPGSPFAYWVPQSVRRLFRDLPVLESNGAEARQGLASGDDPRFVRALWEVQPGRIGRSRSETLEGKRWVPFAKGGEYSPYYGDIHLVVDWEQDGRRIRETGSDARVQGVGHYFKAGITWPERTTSGFGPFVLPSGCVFSHVGHGLFPFGFPYTTLCYLNSRLVRTCMDFLTSAGEATKSGTVARHYYVGLVQSLPWPGNGIKPDVKDCLEELGRRIVSVRATIDESDETTRRFVCPNVLRFRNGDILERITAAWDERESTLAAALDAVLEAENAVYDAIDFDPVAKAYIDKEYEKNPASYQRLEIDSDSAFKKFYTMPEDKMIDAVIKSRGGSRAIATKSYFLDRRIEVLAHLFERHPTSIVDARRRLGLLPPNEPTQSVQHLVSWLFGVAIGRFDVRVGFDPSSAPPQSDFLDAVPICSPGVLVNDDGLPAQVRPNGYPIEFPPDRLLFDEEGHPGDLVEAVHNVADLVFENADAFLHEVEKFLGMDLRSYFRRQFFKQHVTRYTKSRRKAPIYWYLTVPSREWGVWLYAPMISREMLYAVSREARRKEAQLHESAGRLRASEAKVEGRERRLMAERLAFEESLVEEVKVFGGEAERIAEIGWEPDLDDGMILCAAPLAALFTAWPDAAEARAEVQRGEYPWAAVSKWAEKI